MGAPTQVVHPSVAVDGWYAARLYSRNVRRPGSGVRSVVVLSAPPAPVGPPWLLEGGCPTIGPVFWSACKGDPRYWSVHITCRLRWCGLDY